MYRFIIFLSLVSISFLPYTTKGQVSVDSIYKSLEKYDSLFPRHKIHLHTDKDTYHASDVVWLKAYVVSAITHQPATDVKTLYVEIFNTTGDLYSRKRLNVEEGYAKGEFFLKDSILAGNYVIRAYTSWMLNFDNRNIFEKVFHIENPLSINLISRRQVRKNRRTNQQIERARQQYKFNYYPEGGVLVEGVNNRVAFKATNELGQDVEIKAKLINDNKNEVLSIKSPYGGKGMFEFIPSAGSNYSLLIEFPGDESQRYRIRDIVSSGNTLQVRPLEGEFEIIVDGSFPAGQIPPERNPLYLAVHSRGKIVDIYQIENDALPYRLVLQNDTLMPGISVAGLFNSKGEVIAERLFFVPPPESNPFSISKQTFSDSTVRLTVDAQQPIIDTASFSVAVSASHKAPDFPDNNILTTLFITSDISSTIENPHAYLSAKETKEADLLMMVSGWKRYSWQDIQQGNYPDIKYKREQDGFSVYGHIEPTERSQALGETIFDVTLQVEDEQKVHAVQTDYDGEFQFDGFNKHGSYEARLTIQEKNKKSLQALELFPKRVSMDDYPLSFYYQELSEKRSPRAWFSFSGAPEIRKTDRYLTFFKKSSARSYGRADQVIHLKANDERYNTLRDVLVRSVAGVQIEGNSITLRGKSSVYFSNQPLLLVDGSEFTSRQFLVIPTIEVSRLEVFKGSSATIFGLRGANGVLYAHTRRGQLPERVIIEYVLDGYYVSKEFSEVDVKADELFRESLDYDKTVYWEPALNFESQSPHVINISFDKLPAYLIMTIEGVDGQGNVYFTREVFKNDTSSR